MMVDTSLDEVDRFNQKLDALVEEYSRWRP